MPRTLIDMWDARPPHAPANAALLAIATAAPLLGRTLPVPARPGANVHRPAGTPTIPRTMIERRSGSARHPS
ncbi:hypothetical protein [Acuticoccus sp.]|uniref:hypothetical protein n=1 Tax=Acuticoccus sp. TaxID=1904378 RepID=UPI003B52E66A